MELLKQRILRDGRIKPGNILKVDSFLNHQLDINLFNEMGKEFRRLYQDEKVTKILTLEASGIGIAAVTAQHFDNCPVIFAKKTKSKNLDGELLKTEVRSYTRGVTFEIQVAKRFFNKDDRVLLIDDFLATGQALIGLVEIIRQSGAELVGCGIIIEKGFQQGGELIRNMGVRLESLAIIDSIENNQIIFRES
jgi:xanthine phosphoribosyltransferase